MKGLKVGRTSINPGVAMRTLEMYYPKEERLLEDTYAGRMLPSMYGLSMNIMKLPKLRDRIIGKREKQFPGMLGGFLCRTVYIDDVLKESIKTGIKTVITLGAGFDTRPLRIPEAERIRFFEVDEPGIQEVKKKKLFKIDKALPPNVTFVPMDFNTQSLEDELQVAGFSNEVQTLFIWEGVTQYLSREAVENTLKFMGASLKGSRVVFTYVLQSFLDDPSSFSSLTRILNTLRNQRIKWVSGFYPEKISEGLARFNLKLIEDMGAQEHLERYIRPAGRNLQVWDIEHCVLAEVL
jgi:methyltransferase (TIGR00027 family)